MTNKYYFYGFIIIWHFEYLWFGWHISQYGTGRAGPLHRHGSARFKRLGKLWVCFSCIEAIVWLLGISSASSCNRLSEIYDKTYLICQGRYMSENQEGKCPATYCLWLQVHHTVRRCHQQLLLVFGYLKISQIISARQAHSTMNTIYPITYSHTFLRFSFVVCCDYKVNGGGLCGWLSTWFTLKQNIIVHNWIHPL